MKKLGIALLGVGIITSSLSAGAMEGYIDTVQVKQDGKVAVIIKRDGASNYGPKFLVPTGDALKTMTAAVLTAQAAHQHVRMWLSSSGWVSVEMIPE